MIDDYEEADYQAEQDERSRSEYEEQLAQLNFRELEKPVGAFIVESGIKGIRTADGTYYHYQDVCSLLKGYAMLKGSQNEPQPRDLD